MPNFTNPVNETLMAIANTVEHWKEQNTPEMLKHKTLKLLDENYEEIVLKLLGFNKSRWDGKWELDHCNGRSGNSAAGDYIRNTQSEVIKEWLKTVPMPVLTKSAMNHLSKNLTDEYQRSFDRYLMGHIKEQAEKDAKEAFEKLQSKEYQEQFFKALELINPNSKT